MTREQIVELIKEKREQEGISLNALSLRLHKRTNKIYPASQLKLLENNSKNFSIDILLNICEELGLELIIK